MGGNVKYVEISEIEYQQVKGQLKKYTVGYYDEGAGFVSPIPAKMPTQTVTGFQEEKSDDIAAPF